jgi:hypothetical protein
MASALDLADARHVAGGALFGYLAPTALFLLLRRRLNRAAFANPTALSLAAFVFTLRLRRLLSQRDSCSREARHRGSGGNATRLSHLGADAALASVPALLLSEPTGRVTLITAFAMRAVMTQWKALVQSGAIPEIRSRYGDISTVVICLCGSRLTYAWLFAVDTFAPSHLAPLDHYSSVPRARMAELRAAIAGGSLPAVAPAMRHPLIKRIAWPTHRTLPLLRRAASVYVPLQVGTATYQSRRRGRGGGWGREGREGTGRGGEGTGGRG